MKLTGARRCRYGAIALVLAGAHCLACSSESPRVTNVVLISVDSLRPDHLGSYGYPRNTSPVIDSLADRGVLFETVASTTSWTLPAHAALFTGLPDRVHGAYSEKRWLHGGHTTVAEVFRAKGHETVGFFSGPFLHPSWGLSQGFDRWIDCTSYAPQSADWNLEHGDLLDSDGGLAKPFHQLSHEDVTNPIVLRQMERWLAERESRPFFLFVHLWDVHYDYIPPDRFVQRFDSDYEGDLTGEIGTIRTRPENWSNRDIAHLIARYDGEIAFTDETIGELLELLDRDGLLRDTLVVVTSDHGEAFFEHGRLTHRQSLFDVELMIPLVISHPDLPQGLRVKELVSIIDIGPTLLDLAGFSSLPDAMGRSLRPLLREGGRWESRPAIAELRNNRPTHFALRNQSRKLYWNRSRGSVETFDLINDPGEHSPRKPADPARAERRYRKTSEALRSLADRLPAFDPESRPSVDPKSIERLRALGYIE